MSANWHPRILRSSAPDRQLSRSAPTRPVAPDCRHYRGDRPCLHNRLCTGCEHYSPYAERVCIIKLGALGDVIRTLCILPELRRRYPGAQVTWVSLPNGCRMLAGHPLIDRLLPFDPLNSLTLTQETFDLLINLDKEPQPCALAAAIFAKHKMGVTLSEFGTPIPANPEAADYFALGLSDDLKFRQNQLSYPQLVHRALGWSYRGDRYELPLDKAAAQRVRAALSARGWDAQAPTLAINVGAGKAFANKMWPASRIADLARQLLRDQDRLQVLLLGGPEETATVAEIQTLLAGDPAAIRVLPTGTDHAESDFVALVDASDVLFSGDTMAMHVAIARGRGVVAVFGPTCAQEIDLFGLGEKLVAAVDCGPCYKRTCDHDDVCTRHVATADAVAAISRAFAGVRGRAKVYALPQANRKLAG